MKDITQNRIKELFEYKNGNLLWKVKRNGIKGIGSIAGCVDPQGYVVICVDGKPRKAHRLIYIFYNGAIPEGIEIDHKNMIRSDNHIENLRLASHGQNQQNTIGYKNNTSGLKGVFFYPPNKWRARIGHDGKYLSLGLYDSKEDAHKAYCNAAMKIHQEFANC